MKEKKNGILIFTLGAFGYGAIELIWRGRTHWSMLTAGGLSFLGLSRISRFMKNSSLVKKAAIGSLLITCIEFIYGLIFNVLLKKKVWDYSNKPLNVGGQVCALYSFFWFILSLAFIPLGDKINKRF